MCVVCYNQQTFLMAWRFNLCFSVLLQLEFRAPKDKRVKTVLMYVIILCLPVSKRERWATGMNGISMGKGVDLSHDSLGYIVDA